MSDEAFDDWLERKYPLEKAQADAAIAKEEAVRLSMLTAMWASLKRSELVREYELETSIKEKK